MGTTKQTLEELLEIRQDIEDNLLRIECSSNTLMINPNGSSSNSYRVYRLKLRNINLKIQKEYPDYIDR